MNANRDQMLSATRAILADGKWHEVGDLVAQLRDFVDATSAVRRYSQWFKRGIAPSRPLEIKIAMGRRTVIMSQLNYWKRMGLLEADEKPGVNRSYRLKNKE